MNGDVAKFYQDRFGGTEHMVNSAARHRIPPNLVLEACEKVYEAHQSSPFASTVILGQRVMATARAANRKRRTERSTAHDRSHQHLDTVQRQLDDIVGRIVAMEVKVGARDAAEDRFKVLDKRVIPRLDRRLRILEYRHRPSIIKRFFSSIVSSLHFYDSTPYYG